MNQPVTTNIMKNTEIEVIEINKASYLIIDGEYRINITAHEEDLDQFSYWMNHTDCFETEEDCARHCAMSDNPFWFCTVEVEAWKEGNRMHSESEYLGACNYFNGLDFIRNSGYFDDMREACIERLGG